LASTVHHGAALLANLCEHDRNLVLDLLPDWVAAALTAGAALKLTPRLLAWQASRVETLDPDSQWFTAPVDPPLAGELSLPMERILAAGGDSRLIVDPQTGLNRYGTVPRPRPEAVHFSSSTASSISDYGFTLCEMLRHDLLLAAVSDGIALDELRLRLTDGVIHQLMALLCIEPSAADVALAPSGSDTELLAVMLAAAAAEEPLTNVLIAPEETGRAVALAGAAVFSTIWLVPARPCAKVNRRGPTARSRSNRSPFAQLTGGRARPWRSKPSFAISSRPHSHRVTEFCFTVSPARKLVSARPPRLG